MQIILKVLLIKAQRYFDFKNPFRFVQSVHIFFHYFDVITLSILSHSFVSIRNIILEHFKLKNYTNEIISFSFL